MPPGPHTRGHHSERRGDPLTHAPPPAGPIPGRPKNETTGGRQVAGIGIQLNRIFGKRTVTASLYGMAFSVTYTIGPMLVVIGCLLLMYKVLGFNEVGFLDRELFSCSVLYMFLFSLLTSAPFNSTLSKYMADRIYLEHYEDIRPCAYVGIILNLTLSALLGIPFYLRVIFVGHVPVVYVFTSFLGYLSMTLVFAAMVYNSILKHYKKISIYFFFGMATAFLLSLLFRYLLHFSVPYSMLLALTIGFMEIAVLEFANLLRNFRANSYRYRGTLHYFRVFWKLVVSNFLYTFGLFAHNFVFWTLPWHLVVANSYVCNQPYDMASCIAMFTNLSASVIFIARIEMHFHERYADYTNAVIGGKLDRIEIAKRRMFRTLSSQLLALAQVQFVVSVVLYLLANILLPLFGFSGMTMDIYPMLAVGYFITFLMYAGMLFLYYFNDLNGSLISSLIFSGISLGGSLLAARLPVLWYGSGFAAAAFCSFTFIFFRLRWIEKNLDQLIFCVGTILKPAEGTMPPAEVYRRNLPAQTH